MILVKTLSICVQVRAITVRSFLPCGSCALTHGDNSRSMITQSIHAAFIVLHQPSIYTTCFKIGYNLATDHLILEMLSNEEGKWKTTNLSIIMNNLHECSIA